MLRGERPERADDRGKLRKPAIRREHAEEVRGGAVELHRLRRGGDRLAGIGARDERAGRSEEHTSELQSLMRNSYAVLCLKKKKNRHNHILNDRRNDDKDSTQEVKSTHEHANM